MLPLPPILRRRTEQPPLPPPPIPDEGLALLDGGMAFDDEGHLEHYWFHLRQNGHTFYKVVILHALTFLPREVREQMTVLEKMQKVLRGVWNSNVSLVYLAAGIFPQPGIVQCYGVQAHGPTKDQALGQALAGMAALLAAMANYEQAQLEPLSVDVATWLRGAFSEMQFATTVIGQPDPRTGGARGMTSGEGPQPQHGQVGLQQNEMLLRGFARQREPFLELVMATPVDMADITRLQERVAHEASIWASKVRFTRSISAGISLPVILSGTLGDSGSQSYSTSEGYGVSDAVGEARSVSHGVADQVSESHGVTDTVGQNWSSAHSEGVSEVISRGQSHTVGFSDGVSETRSVGGSETHGTAHTTGTAHTAGTAHTEGQATSVGAAHSEGSAHSHTDSVGGGESWSTAQGQSLSHGVADTNSWGQSHVESSGVARSRSVSDSQNWSHTNSSAFSVAHTQGVAHTEGNSHVEGGSVSQGQQVGVSAGVQVGVPGTGVSAGVSASESQGASVSWSDASMSSITVSQATTTAHTVGQADTVGGSHSVSSGVTTSQGVSDGVSSGGAHSVSDTVGSSLTQTQGGSRNWSAADGVSHSTADTVSQSATRSSADTVSQATTRSAADTASHAVSSNWSQAQGASHSDSVADGVTESIALGRTSSSTQAAGGSVSRAESTTQGTSHTESSGISDTASRQHGANHSVGSSVGQSLGWMRGLGLSAGLAPSLSFSKTTMGEDHVADLVAQALGQQERILQTMSLEGGLLVDHYLLTATAQGRQMAEILVPQAFHGVKEVATPVRTRRLTPAAEAYIRAHAHIFAPSSRPERSLWALEPWADSSLLTMLQAASVVAPGVFEEGLAVTTQERIPPSPSAPTWAAT